MREVTLTGCTSTPFGSYLKALGILRLVSEQADSAARGLWRGDTFVLESEFSEDALLGFFLERYEPTPLVAPWNGGSGFYPKDNQEGIAAIESCSDARFAAYVQAIRLCRSIPEVIGGKSEDEDERRSVILRKCRNLLPDRAVDWLDAAVGIAADGKRSFAPVLGTGGNEGRLDYTNNLMARLAALLISPNPKLPVRALLANSLFGERTIGLLNVASGQYDPGRAGGANQGQGIENESPANPWELVLTLEGAVAWASGIYRRQGTAYRSILCSPFSVYAQPVGYGSAADKQGEARAEVWTPLWTSPVGYPELKVLLREGRASVQGQPASNSLEFAEAACSLGVDRGIREFVRYSLLKRRGDSYVALPTGTFPAQYRSEADLIRGFQLCFESLTRDLPKSAEDLRRNVQNSVYHALLKGGTERMRDLMAAFGRLLRRLLTTTDAAVPRRSLEAGKWLDACGFAGAPEVRLAAAVASIRTPGIPSIVCHLSRSDKNFAWTGSDLPSRMVAVLSRRLWMANASELDANPLGGDCAIDPGDASLFIEQSVDDRLIEDLVYAFLALDWTGFEAPVCPSAEVLPVYSVLKHLFLRRKVDTGGESKALSANPRILPLLSRGDIRAAAAIAVNRLRIAGLQPLAVPYYGGMDANRLAASLLIPVWETGKLAAGIFHEREIHTEAYS